MNKEYLLKSDERLDDLECKGMRVIQKVKGYGFNMDSVILANRVKAKATDTIVELGAGCGVISFLVSAKTNAKKIIAVEIQKEQADRASRSTQINQLENKVLIINEDLKGFSKRHNLVGEIDTVVFNPPYFLKCEKEDEVSKSRCEIDATLSDFIKEASSLLKFGGRLYTVNKTERLAETISLCSSFGLESKVLRLIETKRGKVADCFILEAVRGGKCGLIIEPNLIIRDLDGEYTEEVRRIYGK